MLAHAFRQYPSFAKARVVRYNRPPYKSKGFGFVSLLDAKDAIRALSEMSGKYIGHRPIKVRRSDQSDRIAEKDGRAERESKVMRRITRQVGALGE